jgi:hypothetical protein
VRIFCADRDELQDKLGGQRQVIRLLDCDTGVPQFPSSLMTASDPVASLPDEKNESHKHSYHEKHPVLALETQKGKMLDQKLHRSCSPIFCAG